MQEDRKEKLHLWKVRILKFVRGVQFKFVSVMAVIMLIFFMLINILPLTTSRDLIFSEKETSMTNQASTISSSLSTLSTLSRDRVSEILNLLDVSGYDRILGTDSYGISIYDTAQEGNTVGTEPDIGEIETALTGKTVFSSTFADSAFSSAAAVPIVHSGATQGAVYLHEYDTDHASLLLRLQTQIRMASLFICIAAVLIDVLLSSVLTRNIRNLTTSVQTVAEGDYSHRFKVTGHDEVAILGQEFNDLTQRLEETERQRRQFVSDASHELKTPLASIRLLSDSIVQADNMDEDTMRDFAQDIGNEAQRLQKITEKLLDLSKLDDNIIVEEEPVDLKQVSLDALRMLRPLADKQKVLLKTNLDDGCVIMATVDDVYHIVFNLVENAIKYNVPGGSVTLRVRQNEKSVEFISEDTGIGIPEEDRINIFARFYRVDKARSREAGGSGLGLSIVHDCVERHCGTITVGANKPQGSRFTVTFPRPTEEQTGL